MTPFDAVPGIRKDRRDRSAPARHGRTWARAGQVHSGEAALLIVAVNHKGTDIAPLLENAKGRTVVETTAGDLDAAFDNALKKAQATQEAQATSGT